MNTGYLQLHYGGKFLFVEGIRFILVYNLPLYGTKWRRTPVRKKLLQTTIFLSKKTANGEFKLSFCWRDCSVR